LQVVAVVAAERRLKGAITGRVEKYLFKPLLWRGEEDDTTALRGNCFNEFAAIKCCPIAFPVVLTL